ncbi:MAG TPA: DUF5985 family protein [Steroidobacteraceae bacterium]|jgi:hypothetical protein|nr:DUF5985 family protein [Steroidobacteraceae bacterium]
MAPVVYILGTLTTLLCAILLWRGYIRGRQKLLLWSALCFAGLTVSNALVFIDLVVFPVSVDLRLWRLSTAAAAMLVLLFGLIWNSE